MVIYLMTLLAVFYIAQSIDVLFRKLHSRKKIEKYLVLMPLLVIPSYLIGGHFFWIVFMFVAIYWSIICRSYGYGFNYHIPMIIVAGSTFGPFVGILLGTIPFILAPFLMQDLSVLDMVISAILLGGIGAISFLFSSESVIITFAIIALVIYNILRMIFLFGKLPMWRLGTFFMINIGLNYLIIQTFMINLIGRMIS